MEKNKSLESGIDSIGGYFIAMLLGLVLGALAGLIMAMIVIGIMIF